MSRPNSYGSRANRERRQADAKRRFDSALFTCKKCGTIHRRDQECDSNIEIASQ